MTRSYRKVAVASCPDKMNFGSVLQSYALQRFIQSCGFEAYTIDKSGLKAAIGRGRRSYYWENLFNRELYRAKIGLVGHRVRQKIDKGFGNKIAVRRLAFDRFVLSHFDFTPCVASFRELSELCAGYEAVVVGSDQLWLPVNIAGNFYTLSFVEAPTRKIAYATSFGVSELPEKYLSRTREFLSDFAAVSVREDTGSELVRTATGKACRVTCDPTMLLTVDDWHRVATPCDQVPHRPYVLCYFLGSNIWNRECAVEYARQRGMTIVAIAHPDEYVAFDEEYADVYPWGAGPAEWLSLVEGASAVFTDSYHGTVFSAMFETPFFTFRRHESMGTQSTNSRVDTLLRALECKGRLCESRERFRAIADETVDFAAVRERIATFRAESAAFLREALRSGGASS